MANNKKKVATNGLLVAHCDVQEMIIRTGAVHPRDQAELFDKNSCCCTREKKGIRTIALNPSTTVVHYTVQERIMINSTGAMHPFAQAELFS